MSGYILMLSYSSTWSPEKNPVKNPVVKKISKLWQNLKSL